MIVPKFKTGDIVNYPYNNGDSGYYLISGAEELMLRDTKWNIYSAIVLYESEVIQQQDRCGEQITLDMETVDRYSTLET